MSIYVVCVYVLYLQLVGGVAMVNSVLISGDLILRMSNNTTFTVNSEVLVKVSL